MASKRGESALVFAGGECMQMFDNLIYARVGPHGAGADEFHAERKRAFQRLFEFGHDFKGAIVGIQEQLELVVTRLKFKPQGTGILLIQLLLV